MKTKLLNEERGRRTLAVVFDTGDEVVDGLTRVAREQRLQGASLTAIGAFQDLTLGYFDWQRKAYKKTPVNEQVEVVSLIGDIALKEGAPTVHAHLVVAREDGTALGGHLFEGHVRPTLEVIVTESPSYLRRKMDDETGLALIDLSA